MSIIIIFLITLGASAAILYPLFPGRAPAREAPSVSDSDIEQAVRRLLRARSTSGHLCPVCGQPYRPGDQFCTSCGQPVAAPKGSESQGPVLPVACPSCGAQLGQADRFCARCGHRVAPTEEVA